MYQLILASESPRRRDLLLKAGFSFVILPSKISEIPDEKLNIDERILSIARQKAEAVVSMMKRDLQHLRRQYADLGPGPFLILAADTEVVWKGRTLGKPRDFAHAVEMLRVLSGNVHWVKTGVVLIDNQTNRICQEIISTKVLFHQISQDEIKEYVMTGEPMDKAGAYGMQGLGKKFVKEYVGSYENIVGLPTDIVSKLIDESGCALK